MNSQIRSDGVGANNIKIMKGSIFDYTYESWDENVTFQEFYPDSLISDKLTDSVRPIWLDKQNNELVQVKSQDKR